MGREVTEEGTDFIEGKGVLVISVSNIIGVPNPSILKYSVTSSLHLHDQVESLIFVIFILSLVGMRVFVNIRAFLDLL